MMRINKISASPDRVGRFHTEFEDGSILRLYRQTLEDFGLYNGMELTQEEFDRLKSAAGEMSAKMRAVRIVSASSVSRNDLKRRLIQKGEDPEQAAAAVAWMSDLSLVDDRKTAEQIVYRCINKGYGISRAKQALYEKRIPQALWEDALADYPDQSDRILEFLQARLSSDSDEKELRKVIDALMRRGHSYRHIRTALDRLSFDTELLPED